MSMDPSLCDTLEAMTRRLNHAVLFVHDAVESAAFYERILGLTVVNSMRDRAVFLRAPGSSNDHDLGLFGVGPKAGMSEAGQRTVGLYHLAWEVDTLEELVEVRDKLAEEGALSGASNHGASRSLYAKDPSGLEFEVLWEVPSDLFDAEIDVFGTRALDLDADIERFGLQATRNR